MDDDNDWASNWDKSRDPSDASQMGRWREENPFSDARILWHCNVCGGVFWSTRESMTLGLFIPLDPERNEEDRLLLKEMSENNDLLIERYMASQKCSCPSRDDAWDEENPW